MLSASSSSFCLWSAPLLLLVGGSGDRARVLVRNLALGCLAGHVRGDAGAVVAVRPAASADYQFVERHAWMPAFGIPYHVGVDGISLLLVVLTASSRRSRCCRRGSRCTST